MATIAEISGAINQYRNGYDSGANGFVEELRPSFGNRNAHPEVELPGIGVAVHQDGKFGEEGGGEDVWVVFQIGEDMYRMTGYYNSYDGSEWDTHGMHAVMPYERTIIDYKPVE
jgi:hypothetical protein